MGRSLFSPHNEPSGGQTPATDDTGGLSSEDIPGKADVFVETGLPPGDYVIEIIESNGGRLKQQTICDITGWSESPISSILSELEKHEQIHRVRIGRQKVVYLPAQKEELLDLTDADEEGR